MSSFKGQMAPVDYGTVTEQHLIPSTMKGKQFLKRVFLGKLVMVPLALTEGLASYHPPVPVEEGAAVHNFKILFAVARPN